jgi:hypothetical protein
MPLVINFETNEIQNYLKVDNDTDNLVIDGMKAAAMLQAEQFLNTDFSTVVTNEDGTTTTTPNEAPATVKLWVMSRIAQLYEGRGQTAMPDYTLLQPHRIYPFRG